MNIRLHGFIQFIVALFSSSIRLKRTTNQVDNGYEGMKIRITCVLTFNTGLKCTLIVNLRTARIFSRMRMLKSDFLILILLKSKNNQHMRKRIYHSFAYKDREISTRYRNSLICLAKARQTC